MESVLNDNNQENFVVECSTKHLTLLLLLCALYPTGAAANDLSSKYLSVGIAFLTPTNYSDFDFGLGGYVNIGWDTHIGIIEIEYIDTIQPATSDYAHNIEQDRIPGPGSTDYYGRAIMSSWGIISNSNNMLLKAKVGFSYREYWTKRLNEKTSGKSFGLSYGAGIGWEVFEKGYIMLEYSYIDHLVGTGNLGLLFFF